MSSPALRSAASEALRRALQTQSASASLRVALERSSVSGCSNRNFVEDFQTSFQLENRVQGRDLGLHFDPPEDVVLVMRATG